MNTPNFSDIYTLYFEDVYKYLLALCHDEELAEELAQDTFFKAMKSYENFRGDCKITTWLCQIVDCQHFFRQIFLGYFSDIVQAFDTLRKNVCGDDYTSLHNPIVLSSVLPAYGMFHSIQILFL